MSISFKCPNCGKRLRADASRAVGAANCPRCASTFTIPAATEPAAAATPDDADEKPASDHGMLLVRPMGTHDEDLIDMTAMVDIVFFLLIFFMVTSMQSLEAVIGLPTPQAQASASSSVAQIANDPNYVTVTIYEDDTVWMDDEQIFGAQDLRTRLRPSERKTHYSRACWWWGRRRLAMARSLWCSTRERTPAFRNSCFPCPISSRPWPSAAN